MDHPGGEEREEDQSVPSLQLFHFLGTTADYVACLVLHLLEANVLFCRTDASLSPLPTWLGIRSMQHIRPVSCPCAAGRP